MSFTSTNRATLLGTLTRANRSVAPPGLPVSRTSTARFSDSPLMYGNGCEGSTASGVRTGKTWARKYSASRERSAVSSSSQCRIRMPWPASAGSMSSCQQRRVPGDELAGAPRDLGQRLPGGAPVAGTDAQAHVPPALQPGHPDHVELVQVAGEDGEELRPLQQRDPAVLGLGQHPGVELQPGQLAAGEPVVGQVRRRRVLVRVQVGRERPEASSGSMSASVLASPDLRQVGVLGGHAAMIAQRS